MRVVLWTRLVGRKFRERLEAQHGLRLTAPENFDGLVAAIGGADVLVTDGSIYDARLAAALRHDKGSLRLIQLISTGYDGLTRHGVPAGIAVANVGSFYASTVAEHAMALLLALLRRLPRSVGAAGDRSAASGLRSLEDATVAVIGFGAIGRAFAERARPFGARIISVVRTDRPEPLADEVVPVSRLHEALSRADATVLAVPLTDATRRLIGAAELAACRPGLMLINVARGEVVDTDALTAALADGRLGGAGLDVTDPEPLPSDHALRNMPNVLISPHIGGVGRPQAAERIADLVIDNIRRVEAGEPPRHTIDASVSSGAVQASYP